MTAGGSEEEAQPGIVTANEVGATATKRKLSTSAPTPEQTKKSKTEESESVPDQESTQSKVEEVKETIKDVSEQATTGTPQESSPYPLVFYLWAEAIMSLLESPDDHGFLVFKSKIDSVWTHALTLTEEEKEEYMWEQRCYIGKYPMEQDDDAEETPESQKLLAIWNDVRYPGGWWYEVTLEKRKPEIGRPALKVTAWDLDYDVFKGEAKESGEAKDGEGEGIQKDIWWIVDIAVPSAECDKGVKSIAEHVWTGEP
ncbi:hypothetical protein NLI96_g2535 [Meripilus lineatus]|uniref:Uncharacterized protein n=1 Tax=Meripilus lineatus TaxID=2056292 RepID=A0AAD5YGH3_9APHY|nr:hypothetical protein NLI96_g2535 [Physisporinus lineatus]